MDTGKPSQPLKDLIRRGIVQHLQETPFPEQRSFECFFHVNNERIASDGVDARPSEDARTAVKMIDEPSWKTHLERSSMGGIACRLCILPNEGGGWTTVSEDLLPPPKVAVIRYWGFEKREDAMNEAIFDLAKNDVRSQLIPAALTGNEFPVAYLRVAAHVKCFSSIDHMAPTDEAAPTPSPPTDEITVVSEDKGLPDTRSLAGVNWSDVDNQAIDWVGHPTPHMREKAIALRTEARELQKREDHAGANLLLDEAVSLLIDGVDEDEASSEDTARLGSPPALRGRAHGAAAVRRTPSPDVKRGRAQSMRAEPPETDIRKDKQTDEGRTNPQSVREESNLDSVEVLESDFTHIDKDESSGDA